MFRHLHRVGQPAGPLVLAANFLLCAALSFAFVPAEATTVAGRTAGVFGVSATGAATYTIPISAPPGPSGMQPSISLAYNSQAGGGFGGGGNTGSAPLPSPCAKLPGSRGGLTSNVCIHPKGQGLAAAGYGVGWTIQGLSSIYRCNLTFAQDAAPAAVQLATSDGYCMDGQRLRLTSGTYGVAGSTYQTEVANFVTVTAYGSAGNGPAYWVAQDRSARTYTYGNGGSSQVLATGTPTASAWMLNEVSDPPGNTMTISYNVANGSAVPATISWTPSTHGSSSYNYTMTFAYGVSVPQSAYYGYVAGTSVQNTNLLSSITIAYSGTTVKKYVLTYQTSPTTGRDELTQVQECSDSGGTDCLLPTVITYQSGTAGVSATATSLPAGYTHYDFNGDGYPDLLYLNGSTYYVAFGSASGYGTGVSTGIPSTASQILSGNLNGHGSQDGFLVALSGTWYYYSWNGSSFTQTSTGLAYDSTAAQYLIADVNGDGLPDLVATYFTNDGPGNGYDYKVYVRLNTGAGSSVSFGSAVLAYELGPDDPILASPPVIASNSDNAGGFTQALGTLRRFDFNGDGRDDLSLQAITKTPLNCTTNCTYKVNAYELISGGTTTSPTFTSYTIMSTVGIASQPVAFVNFNSDACTDYVIGGTIYVSGCNGSTPGTMAVGKTVIGAMDWDGDGRTDLLVANGSTVGVYLSTGDGLGSLISTSIPYNSGYTYFTFPDPSGDGQDAVGYGTGSAAYYYPHNDAGTPPDLAASFTDGYGNSASPTYVSLVQNNYTENGYGTATYPDEVWIAPTYVVNEVTFSDPSSTSGGTYNQQFWYYGAWTNLQGRGWEGFYATRGVDSRTGLYHYNYFERPFPYTGMQFESLSSNGTFYPTETVNTLASLVTLSSTQYEQRYFAYFSNSTAYQKEVGGTENGDLITTVSTNYTLDNYGNPTTVTRTVTDNDPNSPYNGQTWTTTTTNTTDVDTTHWCLGLFTETQVGYSSSLSGSGSVTRTKTMTPDTTNCRYTQVVTEPSSSQFKVTEALGYDSFGNVDSDTVTGVGMTARLMSANWGTTGQFPMSITDPMNATTQINYNFSYGLKSSVTDPNSLTTSWQYSDGFGRKTQETRPDGTYTTYSYSNCASTSQCLVGSNGLDIAYDVYGTNGTVTTFGSSYGDPIERQLVTLQVTLGGSYTRTDTRYDSLGRVSKRSFPCAYSTFSTTCSYWATNSYDVLNRLTQSQRPISSTNSNLQTMTYTYAGRTITVTDPQSNARVAVSDVNSWLRQTTDPMGYSVTLAYDSAGSKTKVTDSLGNTLWSGTYNYGIGSFLATSNDNDMGAWSFTHDALGEWTGWTDAKSQSFSETYDALSRPLTRSEPDLFTQWTYGSSASSHNIGKLQSVCTGTGSGPTSCTGSPGYSENETYDSIGRLSQRAITLPGSYGGTFTYTWAYNATTGLLNTLTYPTSTSSYALELQYGYANGVLETITDISDTPNVTVWTANTKDPMGHVTEETIGNGIVSNRSFDAVTGWLGTAESGAGGGTGVKNLAFLYDEMGNVIERQDNNLGLTENIYYDNDYRFSYSKLNGTQNLSVSYDTKGNITSRSDVASGATWTYGTTQIHAVTQAGNSAYQYGYDANGNATSRQGDSITWASYNYPTTVNAGSGASAETVSFNYGPDRQRWQQTYSGNSTTEITSYAGRLLEIVTSGGVTNYRHYINAGGENVAVYSRQSNGTNTFNYLLSDHQASIASITNSGGGVVVGESFTPFGSRRNPSTWSGAASNSDLTTAAGITRQSYTFQTQLGLWMGMNHMNGRVEDSITGRMLSADPNVSDGTDSQNYNRYSYVNNNPLSAIDPSGFEEECDFCEPIDGNSIDAGTLADVPDPANGSSSFTGGVSAGMYASMLSSGSYASYQSLGAAYNAANGMSGLGAGDSGNTNVAGTGGSGLGDALRNVPLIGGLLGAAGDVLSGLGNIAAGALTLDAGQMDTGFEEFAGGIGSAAQIGFTDLAAALVGVGGYIYNNIYNVVDVLTLGNAATNYNKNGSFLTAVGNLLWGAVIPDYGMFGGPMWGISQGRPSSYAMNYIDSISAVHDNQYSYPPQPDASANWVGAGFSNIPTGQVAPGPIGIGYFLLGVVPFLVGNTIFGH